MDERYLEEFRTHGALSIAETLFQRAPTSFRVPLSLGSAYHVVILVKHGNFGLKFSRFFGRQKGEAHYDDNILRLDKLRSGTEY